MESRTIVIRNGTLIDGSGDAPRKNDALVIEGNRIRSVGVLPPELRLEDERIEVKPFTMSELLGMIRDRKIYDAKTVAGVLFHAQFPRG